MEGFEDAFMGHSDNGWMDSYLFVKRLTLAFIPSLNERGMSNARCSSLLMGTQHIWLWKHRTIVSTCYACYEGRIKGFEPYNEIQPHIYIHIYMLNLRISCKMVDSERITVYLCETFVHYLLKIVYLCFYYGNLYYSQAHNSGNVFAFMKHINKELKSRCPIVECIHYIKDLPISQYRNKSMMYAIANHRQIFEI